MQELQWTFDTVKKNTVKDWDDLKKMESQSNPAANAPRPKEQSPSRPISSEFSSTSTIAASTAASTDSSGGTVNRTVGRTHANRMRGHQRNVSSIFHKSHISQEATPSQRVQLENVQESLPKQEVAPSPMPIPVTVVEPPSPAISTNTDGSQPPVPTSHTKSSSGDSKTSRRFTLGSLKISRPMHRSYSDSQYLYHPLLRIFEGPPTKSDKSGKRKYSDTTDNMINYNFRTSPSLPFIIDTTTLSPTSPSAPSPPTTPSRSRFKFFSKSRAMDSRLYKPMQTIFFRRDSSDESGSGVGSVASIGTPTRDGLSTNSNTTNGNGGFLRPRASTAPPGMDTSASTLGTGSKGIRRLSFLLNFTTNLNLGLKSKRSRSSSTASELSSEVTSGSTSPNAPGVISPKIVTSPKVPTARDITYGLLNSNNGTTQNQGQIRRVGSMNTITEAGETEREGNRGQIETGENGPTQNQLLNGATPEIRLQAPSPEKEPDRFTIKPSHTESKPRKLMPFPTLASTLPEAAIQPPEPSSTVSTPASSANNSPQKQPTLSKFPSFDKSKPTSASENPPTNGVKPSDSQLGSYRQPNQSLKRPTVVSTPSLPSALNQSTALDTIDSAHSMPTSPIDSSSASLEAPVKPTSHAGSSPSLPTKLRRKSIVSTSPPPVQGVKNLIERERAMKKRSKSQSDREGIVFGKSIEPIIQGSENSLDNGIGGVDGNPDGNRNSVNQSGNTANDGNSNDMAATAATKATSSRRSSVHMAQAPQLQQIKGIPSSGSTTAFSPEVARSRKGSVDGASSIPNTPGTPKMRRVQSISSPNLYSANTTASSSNLSGLVASNSKPDITVANGPTRSRTPTSRQISIPSSIHTITHSSHHHPTLSPSTYQSQTHSISDPTTGHLITSDIHLKSNDKAKLLTLLMSLSESSVKVLDELERNLNKIAANNNAIGGLIGIGVGGGRVRDSRSGSTSGTIGVGNTGTVGRKYSVE
ncbi:hypothetical protein BKA69DRAFT_350360 [Paraphysoderma sedebokerense]|nr:hypothetical protein BKA69DRAFT_350360 [Paraphysoderma sedebokerense]